jgi:hypothetical protein
MKKKSRLSGTDEARRRIQPAVRRHGNTGNMALTPL